MGYGTAPSYLESMISLRPQSPDNLRCSSYTLLLKQPTVRPKLTLVIGRLLAHLQNSGIHCHLKLKMQSRWTLFKLSLKLTLVI